MQSSLLWIGVIVFCVGAILAGLHQELKGPDRARYLDYIALAIIVVGGGVFVAGGMISASG